MYARGRVKDRVTVKLGVTFSVSVKIRVDVRVRTLPGPAAHRCCRRMCTTCLLDRGS